MKNYDAANQAKACFDDVYTAPTPHSYVALMSENEYEIGEQARPYCIAAAELLGEQNGPEEPVRMLDVGCSYGVGSALVKYRRHFDELVKFFARRTPREFGPAVETTREWLEDRRAADIWCVGLDSSAPAIRFAVEAGLLDDGLALNLEDPQVQPNAEQRRVLQHTDLMISTGAIGYITHRTVGTVARELGRERSGDFGPVAVVTILRMFDEEPIQAAFEQHDLAFESVPGVMLPQRSFVDQREQQGVLKVLHDKGIDTSEWEDCGKHYAQLYVAAPGEHLPEVMERMLMTHGEHERDVMLEPA